MQISRVARLIKIETQEQLIRMFNRIINLTPEEAAALTADKTISLLEQTFIRSCLQDLKHNRCTTMLIMLERLYGKAKEAIHLTAEFEKTSWVDLEKLSLDEKLKLKQMLQRARVKSDQEQLN